MSNTIKNNTPRVIFKGMKDESTVDLLPELEQVPIHLPLLYIFAERGPEEPVLCGPNGDLQRIYGAQTINDRSPFYSHATEMAKTVMQQGNSCFIKRLIPTGFTGINKEFAGAQLAGATLFCFIRRKEDEADGMVKQIVRDAHGNLVTDNTGAYLYYCNEDSTARTAAVIDGSAGAFSYFMLPMSIQIGWGWAPVAYDDDGDLALTHQLIDARIDGDEWVYRIPVKTMFLPSVGAYGNNTAASIWVDTKYNSDVLNSNKALVLKALFQERADENGRYNPITNLKSSRTVDFTYSETAYSSITKEDLIVDNIVEYYNDDGIVKGTSPTLGPVGELIMHPFTTTSYTQSSSAGDIRTLGLNPFAGERMIDVIYNLVADHEDQCRAITGNTAGGAAEPAAGDFVQGIDNMLLNIFTGIPVINNIPYYSFEPNGTGIGDPLVTGISEALVSADIEDSGDIGDLDVMNFSPTAKMAFGSGEDGDMGTEALEYYTKWEINYNYNNPDYSLMDRARYPFSAIYDSGYKDHQVAAKDGVKYDLMKWLSYRPDVHIAIATHAEGERLTKDEEKTRLENLYSELLMFSESEEYGTSCARAVIEGHSGKKIIGTYRKRLPLTFELARKRARELGAGNGYIKLGADYSSLPGSAIENMKDINNIFRDDEEKSDIWMMGGNYVQFADRGIIHWPAHETVYDPRNSVLTSEKVMQFAVDVTKQCDKVWKLMVGVTNLTNAQFIERANRELAALVAGRYGNNVRVVPNAYFTPADNARGYSWVQDPVIYANVMKTTQTTTVILRREFDQ